jgi:hypothetical protein
VLKLKYDELLLNFAVKLNLRHYTEEFVTMRSATRRVGPGAPVTAA